MQFDLQTRAKKVAMIAALLVSASAFITVDARQFLAAHDSDSLDPALMQRAVRLDPGNAEYFYRLGRYELMANHAPEAAMSWLHSAVSINPHAAKYWIDLALAQRSLGDLSEAQQSLEHALFADPHSPGIAWQVANLYQAQGLEQDAMRQFHAVLENEPSFTGAVLDTCWKDHPDADFLITNVVPPAAYDAFLEFLISRNEGEAANKVWEQIFSRQQPVDHRYLFEYLRFLITRQDPSQAALVWQEAANLSNIAAYQPSSENLLVNGDFSLDILNGGFDWLHKETAGVSLALDPSEIHSSSHSLQITFDGPGIVDAGIYQLVSVEPGTSYDFSAFFKAADMDGAGGMEFAIQDAYKNTNFLLSEDLRDADFWKKTGGNFVTGPDTHLVVLRIARVPSGSPIRGKLWIDGLRLVRSDSPAAADKG